MRTLLLLCVTLAVAGAFVQAQDPGMMAAQQAQMAAQQASQQAMQDMQQASQNAQMMNQSMQNASQSAQCYGCGAATPKLSVKSGRYASAMTLKMKASGRGAVIYYTTDGWMPTALSTRYTGPLTIDTTTTLQAIAISPYGGRSRVVTGVYEISGTPAAASSTVGATAPDAARPGAERSLPTPDSKVMLAQGTAVPLVFAADVSSKKAEVGDKIALTLADDLTADGVVLVKKGAPAIATVTEVDGSHILGTPGEVAFEVKSLEADGTMIKLRGGAAREGQDKYSKAAALLVVPVPVAWMVRGKDAEIQPGTRFTAFVDADTLLPALQ
jgi:hypothetical protein